ncbi:MAG: hypothetical protein ACOYK1_01605 [Vampirovibrionia bacterium]
MSAINPTRQIATASAGIDQGQQKLVMAEKNSQQVVLGGSGSSGAARHELFLAKSLTGLMREISRFWLQEAKTEQEAMRQMRLEGKTDLATA